MKTIRLIIGSILVYLCVATVYACSPSGSPHSTGGGTGAAAGMGGSTGTVAPAMADESGSRIEVVYLVGDDGSKLVATYYDTQRKEYCAPYPTSDGRYHCMPYGGAGSALPGYYSDSVCSARVATIPTCKGMPKYIVSVDETNACASLYSVLDVGPAVPASSTLYFGSPGSRNSVGAQVPGTSYYSLGATIPASAFVGFAPQTP